MNALIVFSAVVAAAQAGLITPYAGLPLAAGYATPYATPLAAPLAAPSSQYQAQDELGNINYGYANINSAKQEVGNAYGGVVGSYSYVDANGLPQTVNYIADALGFRVQATNLPVAPAVPEPLPLALPEAPVFEGQAPEPVQDTPEVQAAKEEFQKAFDEAANREKREAEPSVLATNILPYGGLYGAGLYGAALPYANGFAYSTLAATPLATAAYATPLATAAYAAPIAAATYGAPVVSAPAAREAILTKIQLTPGHAVAYRVD